MRHAGSFVVTMMLAALPLYACAGSTAVEEDAGPTPTDDGGTTMTSADVHAKVRDAFVAEAQWSRNYGVAALANGPDAQAAFNRLNQAEANVVEQVALLAGDARGAELAALLHARANAFADLVTSIGSKAAPAGSDPQAALDANAQQIADFFVALSPSAFPGNAGDFLKQADRAMVAGLEARAAHDDVDAVVQFDAAQVASVRFADAVGVALSSTFGSELAPATTSRLEDALDQELQLLLGDQAFWMRAYVVDQMQNQASQPELDRSVMATEDLQGIVASYFGPEISGQVQNGVHTDTVDGIAFVIALESGDQNTIDAISAQWDADADALAQYLSANVGVDQAAAQRLLRANVDRERAMIEARQSKQWDAEAANYQMVLEDRDAFAKLVATSIAAKLSH